MPDTLIDAIAKRLQRPSRDVERALGALVGALQDQLADQGSADLPGLGRLVKSGDSIAFESDPALSDAINYRFASGGSPKAAPVLKEAPANAQDTGTSTAGKPEWTALDDGIAGDSGAVSLSDGSTEFALDDLAAEAGVLEQATSVAPPFDPGDDDPEDVLAATQSLVEAPASESFAPPVAGEVWSAPPPPVSQVYEQSTEDLAASLPETEAEAIAPQPQAPRSRTPRRQERGPSMPLIFGALVVIAALVAAFLWLRPDQVTNPVQDEPVATTQDDANPDGLTATDDSLGAVEGTDGGNAATDNVHAETPPAQDDVVDPGVAESSPPAPAPIRTSGDAFSTASAGYTLIVGSTVNERGARAAIRRFSSLGLPMSVLEYQTGGESRFRLCVGQYETSQAADQARRQLADQLPEGTWVRRIRP